MAKPTVSIPLADAVRLTKLGLLDALDWETADVRVSPDAKDTAGDFHCCGASGQCAGDGVVQEGGYLAPGIYLDADCDVVVRGRAEGIRTVDGDDAYAYTDAVTPTYPLRRIARFGDGK